MDAQAPPQAAAARDDPNNHGPAAFAFAFDLLAAAPLLPPRGGPQAQAHAQAHAQAAVQAAAGQVQAAADSLQVVDDDNVRLSWNNHQAMALAMTMLLTDQETQWAMDIKRAVIAHETLQELSDYQYASFALVSRGNLQQALDKIQGLQDFRHEYSIQDTLEEGVQLLTAFTKQQPWYMLDVTYVPIQVHDSDSNEDNDNDNNNNIHHQHNLPNNRNQHNPNSSWDGGHFIMVYDHSALNPDAIRTERDWRIFLGGLYYVLKATQASFCAIREGSMHVAETLNMTWKNFHVATYRRAYDHLFCHYPQVYKQVFWVHSSVMATLLHSLLKSMFRDLGRRVQIGCTLDPNLDDPPLDQLYKVPTPELAEAKLLEKYQTFLTVYYKHQEAFSLPPMERLDDNDNISNHEDDNIHGNIHDNGGEERRPAVAVNQRQEVVNDQEPQGPGDDS